MAYPSADPLDTTDVIQTSTVREISATMVFRVTADAHNKVKVDKGEHRYTCPKVITPVHALCWSSRIYLVR